MSDYSNYSENELLRLVAQGNEAAFKIIYDTYAHRIYQESFYYLRSEELAEDLVQEVFTTIWVRRKEVLQIQHFWAYLKTMSKNLCYQYLLKVSREVLAQKELSHRIDRADETIEYGVRQAEVQDVLDRTLSSLPNQQRHVFHLAKVEGLSHDAIARTLSISPHTVKNHLLAAFKVIRRHLHHHLSIFVSAVMWVFFK